MASPVIPSRHGSRAASPADAGQAAAAAERTDSLARRNLMDAPRYNQAGSTSQQRRQVQYVHPQQSLQHAARLQRPSSGTAGKAKATHVSLAQLLSVPTGGAAVVAVAAAGSGRSAQQPRQAQRTPPGMRRNNSGSKRGREALGASRHPSGKHNRATHKATQCSCLHLHISSLCPPTSLICATAVSCASAPTLIASFCRRGSGDAQAAGPEQALLPIRGAAPHAVHASQGPLPHCCTPGAGPLPASGSSCRCSPAPRPSSFSAAGHDGASGGRFQCAGLTAAQQQRCWQRRGSAWRQCTCQSPGGRPAPDPGCVSAGGGHAAQAAGGAGAAAGSHGKEPRPLAAGGGRRGPVSAPGRRVCVTWQVGPAALPPLAP